MKLGKHWQSLTFLLIWFVHNVLILGVILINACNFARGDNFDPFIYKLVDFGVSSLMGQMVYVLSSVGQKGYAEISN